jgi:hypothetical protein
VMVVTFNQKILTDLNVLSTPEYAEVVFGTVSVCRDIFITSA